MMKAGEREVMTESQKMECPFVLPREKLEDVVDRDVW